MQENLVSNLKFANMQNIFLNILQNAPISRRELQKITGLSWGTVSSSVNELLKKQLIIEVNASIISQGRPHQNILINKKCNFVLGVDINISGLTFVVSSLDGQIIYETTLQISSPTYENILTQITFQISAIISTYPQIIAVSISMQGLLDTQNGISIYNPYFTDWNNVPLKDIISSKVNLPTFLFHDPDCLMKNELRTGKNITPNDKNAIIIRLDDAIGMSILIDGKTYTGASGLAAELGHTTVTSNGSLCYCGKQGCLEAYCSAKGIVSQYVQVSVTNHYDEYDITSIVKKAESGDKAALNVFETMGHYLGTAIANIVNLFEPNIVLINGALTKYRRLFEAPMQENIALAYHASSYKTKISFSNFSNTSPCLGAIYFAVDKLLPTLL